MEAVSLRVLALSVDLVLVVGKGGRVGVLQKKERGLVLGFSSVNEWIVRRSASMMVTVDDRFFDEK